MASDNRAIVITLKLDSSNDGEQKPTNTTATSQKTDKNGSVKAIAAFAVAESTRIAVSELINWYEYYGQKELTLNDDYIGQRNKQIALTHINRAANAISTVASMTTSGAMVGGVAGAIIGAVLGIATSVSGVIRSNVQGAEQQLISMGQYDAQLNYTRARAGWSLKAASIGEDL